MNQRRKLPVRYSRISERDWVAVFPDGERIRLFLEEGTSIADLGGSRHLAALRRMIASLEERERMLVIGSGDGFTGYVLSRLAREVTGFDWEEDWTRYASRRYMADGLRFFFRSLREEEGKPGLGPPEEFHRIALFNLLERLGDVDQVEGLLRGNLAGLENLPLCWSEELPGEEWLRAETRKKHMVGCLERLGRGNCAIHQVGRELIALSGEWPCRYDLDPASFEVQMGMTEQVLNRVDGPLLFGPGIPESWPGDFFLMDQERDYLVLRGDKREATPLFHGQRLSRVDYGSCELFQGIDEPEPENDLALVEIDPRALWWVSRGEGHRERLRERIRPELRNGFCADGFELSDRRGMLVRIDRRQRLPLYPLFDTTETMPRWSELSAYLEWTRKKALITLNRTGWEKNRRQFQGQPHRGLLILKDFDESDIGTIMNMHEQGWRIGLGANRPMDQVPLQSFEKFRLLLERNGVNMEALWMGDSPPDPAYLHNICSRFGRLLISTGSIQRSWDSKKVRFCLTIRAGDDCHSRVQQAYGQMAGIDPLGDYLMLYRWASALERDGLFQAARTLFATLEGARVPPGLDPVRHQAGVLYHLGKIAEAESALETAVRYYTRCLALEPGFSESTQRLKLIAVSQAPGRLDSK